MITRLHAGVCAGVTTLWVALLASGPAAEAAGTPLIEITRVPPYGVVSGLEGRVVGDFPPGCSVAFYIDVHGWWNKPSWAAPTTPVREDGTFACNVLPLGTDLLADRIAAFLLPPGADVPLLEGDESLPTALEEIALASRVVERSPRWLEFSGRKWWVKRTDGPHGPGPNIFSDRDDNVWVDDEGGLHLKITCVDGEWRCAEVVSADSFGSGAYRFYVGSRVDTLDPNVIGGLFTWDDGAPGSHYREIDIEFGRWGDPDNEGAQFVVQPFGTDGNMQRFPLSLNGDHSTHGFVWRPNTVDFLSLHGHFEAAPREDLVISDWHYAGEDAPPPGGEHVRINLWLMSGRPPTDGQEVEMVISRFEFIPLEAFDDPA